eukprot:12596987-Alexandrium_andersonii.AAC.1
MPSKSCLLSGATKCSANKSKKPLPKWGTFFSPSPVLGRFLVRASSTFSSNSPSSGTKGLEGSEDAGEGPAPPPAESAAGAAEELAPPSSTG